MDKVYIRIQFKGALQQFKDGHERLLHFKKRKEDIYYTGKILKYIYKLLSCSILGVLGDLSCYNCLYK